MPGAKLGPVDLLGSSPIMWEERAGVHAPTWTFDVREEDVEKLVTGKPQHVRLVVEQDYPAGTQMEVRGLTCISRAPGLDPYVARVVVTDRRFVWPYIHIGPRRYNVRRRVGNKRLRQAVGTPETDPLVDDIAYHPASLNGKKRWLAGDILIDLLRYIISREGEFGKSTLGTFEIKCDVEQVPIENLEIDDPADRAIARVLAYLPGVELKINDKGTIVLFSRADGSEQEVVDATKEREIVGGGRVELIDNAAIRPEYVDVLFSREIELRLDYDEDPTRTWDTYRTLENVVDIPDYTLRVGDRDLPMGTYITIHEALDAWNAGGGLPYLGELTLPKIRQAMVPYLDLWAGARLSGMRVPTADWTARLGCVQRNFRQQFRINRRVMDAIASIHSYRVATIDPETGARAPAVVFSDFSYLGSQRSMYVEAAGDIDLSYAMNVARYPASGTIGSDAIPSPAIVGIVDSDQGIIRLDYLTDTVRLYDVVLPSQIELEGDDTAPGTPASTPGPSEDPNDRKRPITFDCLAQSGAARLPTLTSRYKAAIILTVLPAYPNNEAQLHRVRIFPEDVRDLLPAYAAKGLSKCAGPPMQVRVQASIETARVAWADEASYLIEQALGISDSQPGVDAPPFDLQRLTALTINGGSQAEARNRAGSLTNIALAHAAAVYAAYADHYEGGRTVPMNTNLPLTGWMSGVQHILQPDGSTLTRLSFPGRRQELSMFSYLDAHTRRLVMRLANPGRT